MRADISRLRVIAILLIVLHHSIYVYYGWPPNVNVGVGLDSMVATMMRNLSKEFGLSIFTFISGWLLWYGRHKVDNISDFIWRKAKRLLIPATVWGIAYHVIYPQYEFSCFPSGVNGTHLWYLLMLFVCMALAAPVVRWPQKKWAWLLTIALFACVGLMRYMNRTFFETCSYFPIFMMGCAMNTVGNKLNNNKLLMGGVIFAVLYAIVWNIHLPSKYIFIVACRIFRGIAIGVASFCFMQLVKKPLYKIEAMMDSSSFAIYLIHQFVIDAFLPFYRLGYPWWLTILPVAIVAIVSSILIREAVRSIDKHGILRYII